MREGFLLERFSLLVGVRRHASRFPWSKTGIFNCETYQRYRPFRPDVESRRAAVRAMATGMATVGLVNLSPLSTVKVFSGGMR
jgi:hypothetical protein